MLKKTIIIIAVVVISGFFYWQNLNSPMDANGQAEVFTVNQGETVSQIAANLRKENLIKSPFYFKYVIWRGQLNLKAGQYLISPRLSAREIIKLLTAGDAISQEKSIRIIEGWNIKDINNYLNNNKIIPENSFIIAAQKEIRNLFVPNVASGKLDIGPNAELLADAPKSATLEGYLFPDTYRIFKDTAVEGIINKMLTNFDKKLTPEIRAEIKRQKKTIYEIITMASIIEKEVRSQADMKIVSGIFWDRIKNGQALESCATLAYILGVNKPQYSLEDIKVASPYNTYKYRGLPPGPIANPGLNAIKAAVYPEYTEYNYFLSDPATGRTIYSKTLAEHNKNKNKYLR